MQLESESKDLFMLAPYWSLSPRLSVALSLPAKSIRNSREETVF